MEEAALTAAAGAVVAAHDLTAGALARLAGLDNLVDAYRVQQRANAARAPSRRPHRPQDRRHHRAMRRYINAPEPLAGEIFASQVHPDGATVRRAGLHPAGHRDRDRRPPGRSPCRRARAYTAAPRWPPPSAT